MNNFIDRKDWNFAYPVKKGLENPAEIYSDLVSEYEYMFIYDGDKVKGADGFNILTHERHSELMEQQSTGLELRYDNNGNIVAYNKKPYLLNYNFVKPEYDYKSEKWIETATETEIVQSNYDSYSKLDTPRMNRLMNEEGIIADYDNFMSECENYIILNKEQNTHINDNQLIPVPSEKLKTFYLKMKEVK